MSTELISKIETHDKLFSELMMKCGVENCECNKPVTNKKKEVDYLLIFVAIAALLISCSATYTL